MQRDQGRKEQSSLKPIRENECEKAAGIIQGKHDIVVDWIFVIVLLEVPSASS